MRKRPNSALALLSFLSFSFLTSTVTTDLSTALRKSQIQTTQVGQDVSSKSDESLSPILDLSFPKDYVRNGSSSTQSRGDHKENSDDVDIKPCNLKAELLQQMMVASGSEWLIDNKTLNILDNDPRELIQCTKPGDRVVFSLTGVHKFKQTLVVVHDLELVGESREANDSHNDTKRAATFTCPDEGPFVRVKSSKFGVDGFVIQNCAKSSGNGTIVIEANSSVTFKNAIFSGNKKRAILVASNASLTLESCYFENNGDRDYDGGAILVLNNVSLSIDDSSFYGNNASFGGVIYGNNSVELSIISSSFLGNSAQGSGGAINLNDNNILKIINTTLSENSAQGSGGAIDLHVNNSLTLVNTSATGNNARGFGGAINLYSNNTLILMNMTLSGNNAYHDGGAIDLDDNNMVVVMNTTISGNSAHWSGGAIYLNDNNSLRIVGATLSGNSAQMSEGAIELDNILKLINTKTSSNNEVWYGGAIRLSNNNTLTIIDTVLQENIAQGSGGAIELLDKNSLKIINTILSGNNAQGSGGAINLNDNNNLKLLNSNLSWNLVGWFGGAIHLNDNNHLEINNMILSWNSAAQGFGGAIELSVNNKIKITNATLLGNKAQGSGGSIYLFFNNTLTITSTTLSGNNAKWSGGAIEAPTNNVVTITNTTLSGNTAIEGFGGAIRLLDNNHLTVTNATLLGNKAQGSGGAIDLTSQNNHLTIMNTALAKNKARGSGGAVHLSNNNNFKVISTTLTGNTAETFGGAINLNNNNLTIVDASLSGNSVNGSGGAIELSGNNNLEIINTSICGNNAKGSGGALNFLNNNILMITNVTLSGNNASDGGAISLSNNNRVTIRSATLSKNFAQNVGGAISVHEGNIITVNSTTLIENQAKRDGGAISLTNRNTLTLGHATFAENYALWDGGAVVSRAENSFTLIRAHFTRNSASRDGGALRLYDKNHLDFLNTYFLENSATGDGGAMRLSEYNNVIVADSKFCENEGKVKGGALSVDPFCSISIASSTILGNEANEGGAIFSSAESVISLNQSKFERNIAKSGGCFYGERSSLDVQDCVCQENFSSKNGGCFYLESSNANLEGNQIINNNATNSGGGICASSDTCLRMRNTSMVSNSASFGGGVAMLKDSRLLCVACLFKNNSADQGGALYIVSSARRFLLVQLTMSSFQKNRASRYGGGMVVKTLKLKTRNCANFSTPCDRIVLDGTSFTNNSAPFFGSSIVGTKPDNILVSCKARHPMTYGFMDMDVIGMLWKESILKAIHPKGRCKSWEDYCGQNDAYKVAIGTFAHKFTLTTDLSSGTQIVGNHSAGFILKNVKSGHPLPSITVTTLDAFGNTRAPAFVEGKALTFNSSNGSIPPSVRCSFKNGTCTIINLIDFVLRKYYEVRIYARTNDVLKATSLTIMARKCVINEESDSDGNLCRECSSVSYNFDLSSTGKCVPCPESANCSTRYIKPSDGYWHKGPCHARVKRCIVDNVCKGKDRMEKLYNLTQNLSNCTISNTVSMTYSKAQCQKGYEGPLCGSCAKSYGLSSSYECEKCGPIVMSILKLIVIICYLLFGASITIQGVLPMTFHRHSTEDIEVPLIETTTSTMEATSSVQPSETLEGNKESSKIEHSPEGVSSSNATEGQTRNIGVAKQKIIEAWKILLNFLQVTSTAATMDVEWTDEVLNTMDKLQVLGAATVNSISRPIDCLLSFSSRSTRVIWRTLSSILIPTTVIAILALYWGYRAIMVHQRDGAYFAKRLLLTMITTTYITYFDLTQVAVRVFNCVVVYDDVDPLSKSFTRSWIADTSIECYKGSHIVLIGIALAVLFSVSIGFPFFCSFALNAKKDELATTNSWAHDTLSFLCGPYRQKFVYWECVTMIKKAALSIIIVFSYSSGSQAQGLLILMVLGFFFYLHQLCNPYSEAFNSLNYFEGGSLWASCAIYTLVQFLNVETLSKSSRSIVSVCLMVTAGCFVFIMVYTIFSSIVHLLRMVLESRDVQVTTNANWLLVLKLYYKNRKKPYSSA